MKTKRAIITAFLIAAITFTLCAFLLWPARETGFYVSYIFVMLGFAVYFGSMYAVISEKFEKMPWREPLLGIGRTHLLLALLLTAAYAVLALFTQAVNALAGTAMFLSMTVYVLAHLVIAARTAYKANALLAGADIINAVNDKRHAQAVSLRALAAEADGLRALADKLPAGVRAEAGSLVLKTAEALRYSDPIVPDALKGLDNGIRSGLETLKQVLDTPSADSAETLARVRDAAEKLQGIIRDRNERVKRAK